MSTTGTPTRALPFLLLGGFVVLVAAGVALSLSTAPVGAVQQLQGAAGGTLASSGFLVTDTNSVVSLATTGPGAGSGSTEVVHVRYQAPDAVEETGPNSSGQIVSVIVVGDQRFASDGSRWEQLTPSSGLGAQAVASLLFPLRAATETDEVVRSGDRYGFVPRSVGSFVRTLLGPSPSPLTSLRVSAAVQREFVTAERISAVVGQERLEVDLTYSSIGSSPPVTVPSGSALVPPPG